MAVPVKGDPLPLHEWRLRREAQNKTSQLAEKQKLFADRVAARPQLTGTKVPDSFASAVEVEAFLGGLSKEVRKLVLMTNKEFRALQGTNASAGGSTTE
jgi:hypothetical protein